MRSESLRLKAMTRIYRYLRWCTLAFLEQRFWINLACRRRSKNSIASRQTLYLVPLNLRHYIFANRIILTLRSRSCTLGYLIEHKSTGEILMQGVCAFSDDSRKDPCIFSSAVCAEILTLIWKDIQATDFPSFSSIKPKRHYKFTTWAKANSSLSTSRRVPTV